jgi:hypothetical protein
MYEEDNIEHEFLKRPKTNPFRTPDRYFESMEDRVMETIHYQSKKKTSSSRMIQFLKPALGLAASFTLVYLLVYYPINILFPKNVAQTEVTDSTSTVLPEEFTFNLASIDDNTLLHAIFSDEPNTTTAETNPDELLAYLSSGLNDVEIYAELQN